MIKKSCMTCRYMIPTEKEPCRHCHANGYPMYEPSELYTAYLAEKERADKTEAKAMDYKIALVCGCCGGTGIESTINGVKTACTDCAEIRKEAREGGEVE